MSSANRDLNWLLSLNPRQFAGASKGIKDSQVAKMKASLAIYWADPVNHRNHSIRMKQAKKDWSWGGSRAGGANPKARAVVTPEGEFSSISEAGKFHGITAEAVRGRIKNKWPGYGYKGGDISQEPRKPHSAYRFVRTPIGDFYTLVLAAKTLNVTTVTVRDRIKRGVAGYRWG